MKLWDIYYKHYKKFLLIPIVLLLIFSSVLIYTKLTTGEFLRKDFSLKGGITATFYTTTQIDLKEFESYLESKLGYDVTVRDIRDVISNELKGYTVIGDVNIDLEKLKFYIEDKLGEELDSESYSSGKQSSVLGEKFFSDAQVIFGIAFASMAMIVFFYFRNPASAFSIIASTLADIVCIFGFMYIFGFDVSTATLGGILMMIGYSTDSDIYMSTYMWKRKEGSLSDRMKHVFKTEATMSIAAFASFTIMYLFSTVAIIKHIAFVLLLGLIFDFIDTWFGTAAIQRIYWERKNK